MKHLGVLTVAIGVAMLIGDTCTSVCAPRANNIADSALRQIRGGSSFYCATVVSDPAGINCEQCTSNGQEGSTKCTNAPLRLCRGPEP